MNNNKQVLFYGQRAALTPGAVTLSAPGYDALGNVLLRAFVQASEGKGKERHAKALPFDQQPMQKIGALYGQGFMLGQAAKKAQESQRLPRDRAVAELLGAINYLAGAVIHLEALAPEVAEPAANDDVLVPSMFPLQGQACVYSATGVCGPSACNGCVRG